MSDGGSGVNHNSAIYYSGRYWNDLPQVLEYMCENFTGDKRRWWVDDFRERYAARPFARALVLNCGNGWVEREFIDTGIARRVVAFDYAADLLRAAETAREGRPIAYFRADANRVDFPEHVFDLVVNVAAMHHVQYIDRFCRVLGRALTPGGLMVNFDYIGPRRNQYSRRQWREIRRANRTLPGHLRKTPLVRPHLATMLHTDPTEAVHSDLIIASLERYFDVIERHDTGGGVAYELLTHNERLWSSPSDALAPHVAALLDRDRQLSARGVVPPLFSYFIARPRARALADAARVARHDRDESRRERWARRHGGTYSYAEYARACVWPRAVRRASSLVSAIRGRAGA